MSTGDHNILAKLPWNDKVCCADPEWALIASSFEAGGCMVWLITF
jgi:hypothetical protein